VVRIRSMSRFCVTGREGLGLAEQSSGPLLWMSLGAVDGLSIVHWLLCRLLEERRLR